MYRRRFIIFYVQHRGFQISRRHDTTRAITFESSLRFLLRSDKQKATIRLHDVPQGKRRIEKLS